MRKCAVRIVRHAADGACAHTAGAVSSRTTIMRECAAMKRILTLLLVAACPFVASAKTMFVMHGGAGTITRQNMTAEAEAQIRAKLEEARKAGHAVLARGGTGPDAAA